MRSFLSWETVLKERNMVLAFVIRSCTENLQILHLLPSLGLIIWFLVLGEEKSVLQWSFSLQVSIPRYPVFSFKNYSSEQSFSLFFMDSPPCPKEIFVSMNLILLKRTPQTTQKVGRNTHTHANVHARFLHNRRKTR